MYHLYKEWENEHRGYPTLSNIQGIMTSSKVSKEFYEMKYWPLAVGILMQSCHAPYSALSKILKAVNMGWALADQLCFHIVSLYKSSSALWF